MKTTKPAKNAPHFGRETAATNVGLFRLSANTEMASHNGAKSWLHGRAAMDDWRVVPAAILHLPFSIFALINQSGGKMLKLSMTARGGVTMMTPLALVRTVSRRTTARVAISDMT